MLTSTLLLLIAPSSDVRAALVTAPLNPPLAILTSTLLLLIAPSSDVRAAL